MEGQPQLLTAFTATCGTIRQREVEADYELSTGLRRLARCAQLLMPRSAVLEVSASTGRLTEGCFRAGYTLSKANRTMKVITHHVCAAIAHIMTAL